MKWLAADEAAAGYSAGRRGPARPVTDACQRRFHAEVPTHRSRQMHGLPAVRDGLLVRELRGVQSVEVADQGFRFPPTGRKVPYTCTQCDEAWCLHACPVEAIKLDAATGAKIVLEDVCVGCKVCTIACPFGTINYVQDTGKVQKCDLCGDHPACVEACPTARDHLRRRRLDGARAHAPVGDQARQPTARLKEDPSWPGNARFCG